MAEEQSKEREESKGGNIMMNRRRFTNVLFGAEIRPQLATLGKSLERKEVVSGLKTDQLFYEAVLVEYNNKSIAEYRQNAFPNLTKGRSVPPSNFQESDDWKKSSQCLKELSLSMINVSKAGSILAFIKKDSYGYLGHDGGSR